MPPVVKQFGKRIAIGVGICCVGMTAKIAYHKFGK
jgi:hypothetical protein